MNYDLHSHSTASDGSLSPAELVRAASKAGVQVLALTDHDSTEGLTEARTEAEKCAVELVSGVEISVSWGKATLHVLGLAIDPAHEPLQTGLRQLRHVREQRAEAIDHSLAKSGIHGALAGARQFCSGGLISRTHFAQFLVQQGHAKDLRAVFKHFLVKNKPGYVAGQWASLEDAVSWIRGAGGVAVIAHPARYRFSMSKLTKMVVDFLECGGRGLEVVSSSHSPTECQTMAGLALRNDLLASCGSDFHGPDHAWAQLGRIPPLPPTCTPVWEDPDWPKRDQQELQR